MSPSRAFWAGGNPTRHPGYLEELRGQPGSSRRLRPGCTRLAQPIGSIAPADSLPAGLGGCRGGGRGRSGDAQRVSCARICQKATLPRPPARPSGRYDETGSAAFCTSTCRSHDVTGFSAPTRPWLLRRLSAWRRDHLQPGRGVDRRRGSTGPSTRGRCRSKWPQLGRITVQLREGLRGVRVPGRAIAPPMTPGRRPWRAGRDKPALSRPACRRPGFTPEEHRHPIILRGSLAGLLDQALLLDGPALLLGRGLSWRLVGHGTPC